ncbi:hypothetical protein [Thermogemmatispora sp.]|uniref:hypothetical protein n=1 Tax=Thermogemmatispora sp. TaxID=1968838 RepID=UPI002ACC2437|nr:hypothetical protein [Thermogemmatispora sp.]
MQSPEPAGAQRSSGQSQQVPEQKIAADPLGASSSQAPASQAPEQASGPPPSTAAAEPVSDFVYPPPPSFYEHLAPGAERRASQAQAGPTPAGGRLPTPSASSPFSVPTSRERPPQQEIYPSSSVTSSSTYAGPGWPQSRTPVAVTRRSRRVVWISLAILGLALLACIGVAAWVVAGPFRQLQQQYNGLMMLVNDYYDAIQRQDYAQAFQDLQPGGFHAQLTQQEFVQEAHDFDKRYGPVLSYQIRSLPNLGLEQGPTYTVEVDVARRHLSYTVLLTVRQVGDSWKIIDFDHI